MCLLQYSDTIQPAITDIDKEMTEQMVMVFLSLILQNTFVFNKNTDSIPASAVQLIQAIITSSQIAKDSL
jgi:hypothetical protein